MSGTNYKLNVFIDSNVIISALRTENSACDQLIQAVVENHRLLICTHTIKEVENVVRRKWPNRLLDWERFLNRLAFELVYTPETYSSLDVPYIRDDKDVLILVSALIAEPDIFVTGDKDFHTAEIKERLAVYTPADFIRDFT